MLWPDRVGTSTALSVWAYARLPERIAARPASASTEGLWQDAARGASKGCPANRKLTIALYLDGSA